jgi:ribosomal protein L37AE/L43A
MDGSAYNTLTLGIEAIQVGNRTEGGRLVRIALRNGDLTPQLRAVAYLWLAETQDDPQGKRAAYNEALLADPNNKDVQQRLAALLATQLPPMPQTLPEAPAPQSTGATTSYTPPPSLQYGYTMPAAPQPAPPPPAAVQAPQYANDVSGHIVGVIGGPNGAGSGFFLSPDGIIATTRYVVGGMERVLVEAQGGQQINAEVVRAFPELDLVLLRVEFAPRTALPITPQPRVADESSLVVFSYARQPLGGAQRPTKRALAAHWIPTTFTAYADAGGAPVFDQQSYLVGMATRNTARNSGHYFALHIASIRARLDAYLAELRTEARAYCPTCGTGSRAGGAGFFFCETCGSTMPRVQNIPRYPLPQAEYYYSSSGIRCSRCGAQVGFHDGRCLRCGQAPETRVL